jgi:hypothetical protein
VTWQPAAYQQAGADVDISAATITLQFSADGHVSGSSGCNTYSGSYTAGAGGQLTFSPLIWTIHRHRRAADLLAQTNSSPRGAARYALLDDHSDDDEEGGGFRGGP